MRVEWDLAKDIENKKKHGISFELASYVFADPNRLERFDRAESNDGIEDITCKLKTYPVFLLVLERYVSVRCLAKIGLKIETQGQILLILKPANILDGSTSFL